MAARVGVDVKTVERWIANEGRRPHRTTRREVATLVSVDEVHLWPALANDVHTSPGSQSEVVHVFPSRSAVPGSLWLELINGVQQEMDVLVFAGAFLVEQYNLLPVVRAKAAAGVRFRFAIGDETSSAVIQRAIEEGTVGGLEGRVQLMRRYLHEVAGLPNVEVRTHGTPLYNSIYRFDDQMLVNGHSYGSLAGQNPVLHLQEHPGGIVWTNYRRSFDRVWQTAVPETPPEF
ncbi:XRE family transcriptional regulator [Actinokineospora soli]|uniref:XRE family transcriptional regulator n=1 Tax=Actinokineospora soli TaxID=1048753 RepID=A0ABW2THL4_9PSEU